MKNNKIKEILKQQIKVISPSSEEISVIKKETDSLIKSIKSKTNSEVFVGGSFAKNTLIKKKKYDIDIFVRFNDSKDISNKLGKILGKNAERIHGSRDYFVIKKTNLLFEIIPVFKIKKPEQAENITDLSYFHVKYVDKKTKSNKKILDEIRLAKAFAYYQDCYGAESYINGFSGYAVELLVIHYRGFINFLRAMAKANINKSKIIIDQEKLYKNKDEILREVNEAKLHSPIVFIDPTFRERNVCAAVSLATFLKFQVSARKFLANPSSNFFKEENKEENFMSKNKKAIKLTLKTSRQAGDIAGTKLRKFSNYFIFELKRYFDVKVSEFDYDESANMGKLMLVINQKKEIIFPGPPIAMKDRLQQFKKEHKHIKIKAGKAYATEKSISFNEFLGKFKKVKVKIIESMGVKEIII